MRWLSFTTEAGASYGLATARGVIDVGRRVGRKFPDLKSVLAGDALAGLGQRFAGEAPDHSLGAIEYLPVIPNPDKIFCVGLNYKSHQEETGRGGEAHPTIFTRCAACQVGHDQTMVRPRESEQLDYEGEIALVIGRPGRRLSEVAANRHIAGFAPYNDASVRDFQRHTSQFTPGKNFAATGGFGPWLMTPDEVGDPRAMEITTRLNGEVMQNATAALLIFGFTELIRYCSTFVELAPGDVIVTGTPGGVGAARRPPVFLGEGDVIEVEVKPIGTLRHRVAVG